MFKLFRCQICGDPYLGNEAPSNCPFCGAKREFMVDGHAYINRFTQKNNFTDQEMEHFRRALDLEIGNASFYLKASTISTSEFHKALFKGLSKVENEHASIFTKHLGITKPGLDSTIEADTDGHVNLLESHRREQIAIKAYKKFLDEAVTPRAKEIFTALLEIETDHLGLED